MTEPPEQGEPGSSEQGEPGSTEPLDSDTEQELQEFEFEHEREHVREHGLEQSQHAALRVRLARLELLAGLGHTDAGRMSHHLPAWLRKTQGESRFAVAAAVVVVIVLQLTIDTGLSFHPKYLMPVLEVALFVLLSIGNPVRLNRESGLLRSAGLLLVTAASFAVAWSAATLVWRLAHGTAPPQPITLLLNGGAIWLTNVIVFALWYWELDRGGPAARAVARKVYPDFLFSQMTVPELVTRDWEPAFVDYLYLSFTNATAFSPTDTLPLSRWAKLAMMFQSLISLVTVALVVARAVNILK